MSNIVVLKAKERGQIAQPRSVKTASERAFYGSEVSPAYLVDCMEDAMHAVTVRVHLIRWHDQLVCKDSPKKWKQLTRIESRLKELQVAIKSVRT